MENIKFNLEQFIGLVQLHHYRSLLIYDLQKLPGAMTRTYLDSVALERLDAAAKYLEEKSKDGFVYEILIWDAFRTRDTQSAIYSSYARDIAREENISFEEAYPKAKKFVNSPDAIFPHGTGGAVDVTLLINGTTAEMGSEFDEFTARSHKDYFREHLPENERDKSARENREMLRSAMEYAGFIGLDSEWWHYEWGTNLWAEITGKPAVLSTIYSNPHTEGRAPAYIQDEFLLVQPVWFGE